MIRLQNAQLVNGGKTYMLMLHGCMVVVCSNRGGGKYCNCQNVCASGVSVVINKVVYKLDNVPRFKSMIPRV